MRFLLLMWLKHREIILDAQVANGEALLADHRERLRRASDELRRVRRQISLNESPQTLLAQALRSRATR